DLPLPLDDNVMRAFGNEPALDGVSEIVVSPGVPLKIPLPQSTAALASPIVGEIELAYRYLHGTVIAVTGSNGKSTTTTLIGEILGHGRGERDAGRANSGRRDR